MTWTYADTHAALKNVLSGRTARGEPASHPPLSFSKTPSVLLESAVAAQFMLRVLADAEPDPGLDDAFVTTLLWKLAAFAMRRPRDGETSLITEAALVANLLFARPSRLLGTIGMAALLRQARRHERRLADARAQSGGNLRLKPTARQLHVADRPIRWQCGHFTLEELIHPAHIARQGYDRENCLSTLYVSSVHDCRVELPTGERVFQLSYWRRVAVKGWRIYSLRCDDVAVGTIAIRPKRLTVVLEDIEGDRDPQVALMLDACLRELANEFGPMRHGALAGCRLDAALAGRRRCFPGLAYDKSEDGA